jgi:hypothetical protein
MAKFAVTLSNGKIVYPTAPNMIAARERVERQIPEAHAHLLRITDIRKVSGR